MNYWRTGRKVGRTIYAMERGQPSDEDVLIGLMDTPELATAAVEAHNLEVNLGRCMKDAQNWRADLHLDGEKDPAWYQGQMALRALQEAWSMLTSFGVTANDCYFALGEALMKVHREAD